MNAKYEVSISYSSKVIAKVKVDNRQTDRQTDRQDKNNMQGLGRQGAVGHSPINLKNGPLKSVKNEKKWPIENFKINKKS